MLKLKRLLLAVGLFLPMVWGELRWCKLPNSGLNLHDENWVQYDDSNQTCITCSPASVTLVQVVSENLFECCDGTIVNSGNCSAELKESGNSCSNSLQCDGRKQCEAGTDESGCGVCSGTDLFSCLVMESIRDSNLVPCVQQNKVCDGRKDCRLGLDETGCRWHDGWCTGFLCGGLHPRCIPKSKICDGTKHCVDGSDEFNCQFCDNQFRCKVIERDEKILNAKNTRSAECVGKFRICDGKLDCENGLDEKNCFRWMEWSPWSDCSPPAVCNRTRTRQCVDASMNKVDESKCYDVEDYDFSGGDPVFEAQNELCPPCRPPTTITDSITTHPVTATAAEATSETTTVASSTIATTETTTVSFLNTPSEATTKPKITTFQTISITDDRKSTDSNLVITLQSSTQEGESTSETRKFSLPSSATPAATASNISNKNYVSGRPRVATTAKPPINQSSTIALAIIIVIAVVAGILLLLLICCLVFCFREKKHKTGKWTPRKFLKHRPIKVPQMYYDVSLDEVKTFEETLPTNQKVNEPPVLNTFTGAVNPMAGIDSGIDANSMTSSESGSPKVRSKHRVTTVRNPLVEQDEPPFNTATSDDFPPPPPQFIS